MIFSKNGSTILTGLLFNSCTYNSQRFIRKLGMVKPFLARIQFNGFIFLIYTHWFSQPPVKIFVLSSFFR